jgi:hypothetical protein
MPVEPTVERVASFHGDFAGFQEGYVRHYISLADTKAAWAFAISAGLLAFLFGNAETPKALLSPSWSVSYSLLIGAIAFLVASALFSFLVVAPRLTSRSGEGVVFFAAVASKSDATAYVREIAAHDERAVAEARIRHCYDVSVVCTRKYASLKKAIWLGLPAVALTLAHVLTG